MTAPTNKQTNQPANQSNQQTITPEMVRQVTEKVYALWLKESEVERERYRAWPQRGKR
ncbi:MAG: hypothetical protein ACE5FD_14060 [Anaerolineae bacterium]